MYYKNFQDSNAYLEVIFNWLLDSIFVYLNKNNTNGELGVPSHKLIYNQKLMSELLLIGFCEIAAAYKNLSITKDKTWKEAIAIHYGKQNTDSIRIDTNPKYKKGNFLAQCIDGTARVEEYQDFYRYWQQNCSMPLYKYLGMTQAEYKRFQKVGENGLVDILIDKAMRKKRKN